MATSVLAAAQAKSIGLLSRPDQSPSRQCHLNDRWKKAHVLIEQLVGDDAYRSPLASTRCPPSQLAHQCGLQAIVVLLGKPPAPPGARAATFH